MPAVTAQPESQTSGANVYRPRRPTGTLLHKIVREHLETYLTSVGQDEDLATNVPFHVQAAFREYIKCGILAHGFARVYHRGLGPPRPRTPGSLLRLGRLDREHLVYSLRKPTVDGRTGGGDVAGARGGAPVRRRRCRFGPKGVNLVVSGEKRGRSGGNGRQVLVESDDCTGIGRAENYRILLAFISYRAYSCLDLFINL